MPTRQTATANIDRTIRQLAQRQLGQTALLFLAGHRPLAFAGGQFLHLLAPLATLIGADSCAEWARLLSDEDGLDHLERALSADSPAVGISDLTAENTSAQAAALSRKAQG